MESRSRTRNPETGYALSPLIPIGGVLQAGRRLQELEQVAVRRDHNRGLFSEDFFVRFQATLEGIEI